MLASRSGSILAGYSARPSVGIVGVIYWRATLGYSVGCLARSTDELLWDTQRDTRWDPLTGCSGGILGGIHWRAALAGSSGGILGGIHWQAALAGYSAGSTGELLWRDTGWGRGVEASQTRIPT